ncbi:guanine nucleotide dissociation stimulator [Candida orthopsilosis Co 90-125]|uniref:Guanine nucleotide dissociation stimulator n=1 Tax=Candida orthopsilosis (strain 90-125) TaxID=1136231 RepID=H8X641_CANO9|nr:guanine nucleotide dissociation stimulator [Candida orthopsilosis Co 90-125]CCG23289.1 guanine nucleotide dissociation stimulator [Candida orthopsilosis Co 90-125]
MWNIFHNLLRTIHKMPLKSRDEIEPEKITSSKTQIVLRCPFTNCNARIIAYSSAIPSFNIENAPNCVYIESFQFDKTNPKLSSSTISFYRISDVWDFDNIGVSKPSEILAEPIIVGSQVHEEEHEKIDVERLLICSECDRGPLGFAGIVSGGDKDHRNLKYFLSQDSVLYDVES